MLRRAAAPSPPPAESPTSAGTTRGAAPSSWLLAAALVLVVALAAVYSPTFKAGFIWDDDAHLTPKELQSAAGLARIWTDPTATQQYYPLLHSLFWLEHRLWGDAALGYHLANLALHAAVALLLFALLRRLAIPGAFAAAAIFAIHPVHVESVAWITEQKNTLSAACFLGAALAYLRFHDTGRRRSYALASLLFVGALLSKSVTATLPAALLVLLWWRAGRIAARDVVALAPWWIVGAASGLFTAWVERTFIGAPADLFAGFFERLQLAGTVGWFYAAKLLWPVNLSFVYPRWELAADSLVRWLPTLATIATIFAAAKYRHQSRAPLAAVLLFGGLLFPVLGFFDVYPFRYSFVADHFQYLASIPLLTLGVAALVKHGPHRAGRRTMLAVLTALPLAAVAWSQARLYRDNQVLFTATLARNPKAWMAHNNLGHAMLGDRRRLPEALDHLTAAVRLAPHDHQVNNNLGWTLTELGRPEEAIAPLETALRARPQFVPACTNLGIAHAKAGRPLRALGYFKQAAALAPAIPSVHDNLGRVLLLLNRREEASRCFAEAERLRQRK